METVRRSLPEGGRGLERGCRFMITANLLDDMRVHLLFNRLSRDPQGVLDRERCARTMRNDADSIHAQKRTPAVFLVICFVTNGAKRFPREQSAQFSRGGARELVFQPLKNRHRD